MNTNYNFQQPSRCLQRCLSLICLLTFLLVGLSGADAQTAISATSTNTNSPLLRANGKIAFSASSRGYLGIYTRNRDGSELTRLTSGADIEPAWSPDGTQIAFTRFYPGTRGEIFVMNADGSNQRRLTANANDRHPTWSPDGTKIAFSSFFSARYWLSIMNADGSNQRGIQASDNRYYYQPAWSPDGSKLAVLGGGGIYLINIDGTNPTRITQVGSSESDADPAWSPDGSKLAFTRGIGCDENDCWGGMQIWVVNADGSNPTMLRDGYYSSPAWSPDGTKIVFSNSGDLFVMKSDGSGLENITNTSDVQEFTPSWQAVQLPPSPTNPIDDAQFFVRQHYLDFLNREPDPGGLSYWTNRITECGSDLRCIHDRRIGVSAAFFIEQEFQDTGYYVYRVYKASFGRQPNHAEFTADRSKVVDGSNLEANKQAFADEWVQRPAFVSAYPNTISNTEFVNKLFDTAGLTGSTYNLERQQEIAAMNSGRSRALILRDVIEIPDFKNVPDPAGTRYSEIKQTSQYNPAFVLLQYFGYLRRDVDQGGYDFWLDVVNKRAPNNYRGMVCAFLTSTEYQHRFGSVVTRSNADCGP